MNEQKLISELTRMVDINKTELEECIVELNNVGNSNILRIALEHYKVLLENNIERCERDLTILLRNREDVC